MIRGQMFVLFLAAMLLTGVGCGKPVYVLNVADNIQKWKGPAMPAPAVKKQTAVTVRLVGTPSLGHFIYPKGESRNTPFGPIYLGTETSDFVPIEADVGHEREVFDEMLKKNDRALGGTLIKGLGEAERVILQEHLSRYYENAKVELLPTPAPSLPLLSSHLDLEAAGFTRTVLFKWTATLPGGRLAEAEGHPEKANAAGHLGWLIPVCLTAVYACYSIGSWSFEAIYKGMEEDKTIQAIDLASASLAAQIASMTPPPEPKPKPEPTPKPKPERRSR